MPETYINDYELLNVCPGRDPGESISFTELENDLGEGMESSILFGSNTGNRRFKLSFQILSGASNDKTVEYKGRLFTPQDYLWDLFCRTKVTGKPFVAQSLRNDQYYLVKFADKELSYTRMLTKLFTSGVELKQVRKKGVTVFDVAKIDGVWGWYKADTLNLANGQNLSGWSNLISSSYALSTANLQYQTPSQNGRGAVVFNGVNGYAAAAGTPAIKDVFIALKINQATFSNYGGVVTNNAIIGGADAALVGASGTTKFENFSRGQANYTYLKNSISFAESNQQAPMNKFAVVHVRHHIGFNINYLLVGSDRLQNGRYANMTVGEMIFGNVSDSDARELTEYLAVKWGI